MDIEQSFEINQEEWMEGIQQLTKKRKEFKVAQLLSRLADKLKIKSVLWGGWGVDTSLETIQ